ncbi:MAG: ABC transporter ATP-binding protein [Deltaproteobacteria bacterium]|nr:ABC transporter ATP-binding protein [Deltaproteobacteria bacterium]
MLHVQNISSQYGSIIALKEVSIKVNEGEMVTVIGPNGAGKTTLLKTISGFVRPSSGKVIFFDNEITHLEPHGVVRAGISQVLQGRQVFEDLTVLQNLTLGAYLRNKSSKSEIQADLEIIFELFPILQERRKQKAGTLSGGEQMMLVIGRALMAKPKLLLLDEPSLGLAPLVVDRVAATLERLNKTGLTMLLVEQNAEVALTLANRCYIMELGRIALEGETEEIRSTERVVELYLGKEV